MFYNGLTVFDPHLVPQPELALSVENADATVWTIKLRKDVHFHDGAPFTAADVVFSLSRLQGPEDRLGGDPAGEPDARDQGDRAG